MAVEEQTNEGILIVELRSGGGIRSGQRLTISDRIVSKLSFPLTKSGSATGNVTFTIRRVSNGSLIQSKVLANASTLTGTIVWYEVEFDTPVSINEEVRIAVEFSGGSVGNGVNCYATTSSVKAGELYTSFSSSSWNDTASSDAAYKYTYIASGVGVFPSDAITRVTSLTHRYDRGTYTLELHLGEVISDFGLPDWTSAVRTSVPVDEEYIVKPGAKEAIEKALAETTWGKDIEAKKLAYEASKRAVVAKTELEQEIAKFKRMIPTPAPTAPVSKEVVTDPGLRKYLPKAEPAPEPTGEPWWMKFVGSKERIGE